MYVLCVIKILLAAEANVYLYIILYPAVIIMCYVYVIYFLQPIKYKLTEKYFSAAKDATQLLSELCAAATSVSYSCTNFFQ